MTAYIDGKEYFITIQNASLDEEFPGISSSPTAAMRLNDTFHVWGKGEKEVIRSWTRRKTSAGEQTAEGQIEAPLDTLLPEIRSLTVGFRPVLYPLHPNGMVDRAILTGIADGAAVELGGLQIRGIQAFYPEFSGELQFNLWAEDVSPHDLCFTDTPVDSNYRLIFIKVSDHLVCDRVILTCISANDLEVLGLMRPLPPGLWTLDSLHAS